MYAGVTTGGVMFAQMHIDAGASLGMNPITIFAGQNAGASLGNMICPNNTVAACATVDQVGNESQVMRLISEIEILERMIIMSKKRVLGVIGLGHVGAHVAYSLAVQGIADELILVDKNEQKVASEVQDLRDAAAYLPHRVTVRAGSFADLGACDVIVNSVGKIELLRETHDRLTEMDFTIPAVRSYAGEIKKSGFDGVLINITNPCDIVTRELALGTGLPRGRVFGTGTGLDTSRLLSALARQTGIDHKSITCYMLGEHGNQQFAPWSCVSFRGMPLERWAEKDERFRFDRDALQKESIGGGWVTFSGKLCTEYGIATTAARMAHIVLHDEKTIMPASAELCGEYGESGLFAGVPCVIGANGVEQVVELPLTEAEKAAFHSCCEGIRKNMEHLKEI